MYLYRHSRMYSIDAPAHSVSQRKKKNLRELEGRRTFTFNSHMTISIVMVDTQSHFPSFVGPCRLRTWISQQKRVSGVGQDIPLKSSSPPPRVFPCFISFCRDFFFNFFVFSPFMINPRSGDGRSFFFSFSRQIYLKERERRARTMGRAPAHRINIWYKK